MTAAIVGFGSMRRLENNRVQEGVHEDHAFFDLIGWLGPGNVVGVGEEFVVHGGDEGGGGSGFLGDAMEGGLDGIKECRVETVLTLPGEC